MGREQCSQKQGIQTIANTTAGEISATPFLSSQVCGGVSDGDVNVRAPDLQNGCYLHYVNFLLSILKK